MRPVIAFDIGLSLGFCVLNARGEAIDIGLIEALDPKYKDMDVRLRPWLAKLDALFQKYATPAPGTALHGHKSLGKSFGLVIVAFEKPRKDHTARGRELGAKARDTLLLSELSQEIVYRAGLYHCDLERVDAASGHIALTGQSGGDKENSRTWANRRLPAALQLKRKKDHHAADAYGVALRAQSQANHTSRINEALEGK